MSTEPPTPPTLAEVVTHLERRYPPSTAESWDAVGTVCGDPGQPVHKVLFAVDPTAEVVDEALAWGADLLVTHHPLLLRAVHSVAATTFKGALVHRLVRGGCALHVAHTNADAAEGGVADALAEAVGLVETVPLVPLPAEPLDVQPAVDVLEQAALPGATGTGRLGRLTHDMTLRELAQQVADALPATEQGVRVAGDLDAVVRTVAVVGGSGDSLFDAVRRSGAEVYVTADLRHHPASELRERAEFEARSQGRDGRSGTPFLVDVAHFASEWPWLGRAAAALEGDVAAAHPGTTVETRVSVLRTDPWTARLASPSPDQPAGGSPL